tara:strand:- start:1966 stop:2373 length:408 start_codon:yes stop_codon:yes gene_type:complete
MNTSVIGELLEQIFDIKENIKDQEYRNIMETLHKLHKCDTPLGYIKEENLEQIDIYSVIGQEVIHTTENCYRLNQEYVIVKKEELEEAIHYHITKTQEELDRAMGADELDIGDIAPLNIADLNIQFLPSDEEEDE